MQVEKNKSIEIIVDLVWWLFNPIFPSDSTSSIGSTPLPLIGRL